MDSDKPGRSNERLKLPFYFLCIKDYIKNASNNPSKKEALEEIREAWNYLDDSCGLAEARMNILLNQIGNIELALEPKWLTEADSSCKEDRIGITKERDDYLISTAKKLIRACVYYPEYSNLEANLYYGVNGKMVVDWEVEPNKHQWVIDYPMISWPGLLVYTLNREGNKIETKTFHDAFAVIDYFRDKFSYIKNKKNTNL